MYTKKKLKNDNILFILQKMKQTKLQMCWIQGSHCLIEYLQFVSQHSARTQLTKKKNEKQLQKNLICLIIIIEIPLYIDANRV